jgi:curved DNA-binding protein CbpA
MPRKNYYEVLKVARNASQEEITAVYRELAKKWHPDKYLGLNEKDAAAKGFKFFQNAYDVLGNPEKRKRYDEKLLKHEESLRKAADEEARERCEAEEKKQRESNEQEFKLQEQYERLVRAKDWEPTESEYRELAKKFWAMNGYKDSAELARHCEARYQSLKELREAREPAHTEIPKHRPILYWISGAVLVLALIVITIVMVKHRPATDVNIQQVQGDNPFEDPTIDKTDNPFAEDFGDNPFVD